jgi:hypothetical protein
VEVLPCRFAFSLEAVCWLGLTQVLDRQPVTEGP